MLKKKFLSSLSLILTLLLIPSPFLFAEESITITTYYPSPYGVYRELRSQRMAIGDDYINGSAYCWEGTCTTTINANADLVVQGNVGIGTPNPGGGYRLHVAQNTANAVAAIGIDGDDGTSDGGGSVQLRYNGVTKWSMFERNNGSSPHALAFSTTDFDYNTAKMVITQSGNVGIGTTNPGTYKLYINGTGYLNAAAWVYGSDIRLKENISYIQSGLNVIENLKPAKFDFIKGDKRQVGFIAQEVQEILPDIVTEGTDGMLGIKTDSIIPYLVKAIQEQRKEIEELKQRIERLEKRS